MLADSNKSRVNPKHKSEAFAMKLRCLQARVTRGSIGQNVSRNGKHRNGIPTLSAPDTLFRLFGALQTKPIHLLISTMSITQLLTNSER